MKLLFSIVLLKMKAQEKSRHCPFVVNTSVSQLQLPDQFGCIRPMNLTSLEEKQVLGYGKDRLDSNLHRGPPANPI